MSVSHISPKIYSSVIRRVRAYFESIDFTEAYVQSRQSILAACEDPTTISEYTFGGKTYPLPQTGQMWLEVELLRNPEYKGLFITSTTSFRNEKNPIPGRHKLIFPMVEFETHGDIIRLERLMRGLLEHLGYGDANSFPRVTYDDMCEKYGVDEIEDEQERQMLKDYGPVVFLTDFNVTRSNPFWNMKRVGNISQKIDVILDGFETFGSAERSSDPKQMKESFMTQSSGEYKQILYDAFGQERVDAELDDFLKHDFISRCGGGIGLDRLIRSMELRGLLDE